MLWQCIDVLAYSYEYLKSFRPKEAQHEIPLKAGALPYKQKQRQYNPNIFGTILSEIQKMLNARIIFPIHHSTWIANIIPVRKKNGEILICVDFKNLNQLPLKYSYPLPVMDQVLQMVTRSKTLSMLDGFLGYNQVEVSPNDQHKTSFTTLWGIFSYRKMPFGFINASSMFQGAMNLAFYDVMGKFIIFYLDDLTIFSKKCQENFNHLKKVLERCRQHGISLNSKK